MTVISVYPYKLISTVFKEKISDSSNLTILNRGALKSNIFTKKYIASEIIEYLNILEYSSNLGPYDAFGQKLDGVGPVDNRPSTN